MASTSQLSRVRAGFGVGIGVVAVGLGIFLRTRPSVDAAWCGAALALSVAALLSAWVTKPERDPYLLLGTSLAAFALAVVMPILALLEPTVRAALVPAAMETAGGFTILAGAIRWSQANAKRALKIVPIDRNKKVRVLKQKKKTEVPVSSLVAGDELHLSGGDDVPVDGVVIEGSGFIDESTLMGPTLPSAKKPGDVILAGSENTSIPELAMRVEVPQAETILAQRESFAMQLADDLIRLSRIDVGAFSAAVAIAVAGSVWVTITAGVNRLEVYLPSIAALMIAASAGPSMLAGIRGRLRSLSIARAAGLIVIRAKDVLALPRVRRWQIDSNLLAAPGGVETVAFADAQPDKLLRVAAALLEDEKIPEAVSVFETLRAKKLDRAQVAANRKNGSLYLGTVEGERWFMGPPAAVAEEEGKPLDKTNEGPVGFLRDRGMTTWLIGRPGGELAGAIGIGIEADLDAKTAAAGLAATIMPGPPDGTRQALATKAAIRCDGPPLSKRDGTILTESAAPPSTGLRVRVLPVRTRISLEDDRSPRLFAPSLGGFGHAMMRARRAMYSSFARSIALAIVPGVLASVLAYFGVLWPIAGTGVALVALAFAGRVAEKERKKK